MIMRARLGLVALAVVALLGCGHHEGEGSPPDGGAWFPDGGAWPPDGGAWPPDGGGPHTPQPVLRQSLGIDLSQVRAFAVVSGASNAGLVMRGGSPLDSDDGGVPTGPQLLALTLDGDVLVVTLVENGDPQSGVVSQPEVQQIYPTASWVLFSTPGFNVLRKLGDGSYEPIPCSLIAARRSDGALYCAPLVIGMPNVIDGRFARVQTNAAGDVAYAFAAMMPDGSPQLPDTTDFRLYKITLGGADGPTAALATNSARYQVLWFLANAAGDLMINYWPTPLDQSVTRTEILPADGGATFTLQGEHDSFVICGEAGAADEDTFYVLSGGSGGYSFDGTILAVTRSGSSFVETPHTVTLANAEFFGGLYRLADGVYMFNKNDKALARVIAEGTFVADPTTVAITGVDQLLDIQGLAIAGGSGQAVFLGSTASGYEFIRHDGLTQQDIPLEANLELWRVTIGSSGAIDFIGVRTDTQEKIRGSVAAGETTVTIVSDGALDPDQVVVFTQIN
jgi:hypothetical protein